MMLKRYLCGLLTGCLATGLMLQAAWAGESEKPRFLRVDTQYIAALGDPDANSGSGAQDWGLWTIDPGPRGVWLKNYDELESAGATPPGGDQVRGARPCG